MRLKFLKPDSMAKLFTPIEYHCFAHARNHSLFWHRLRPEPRVRPQPCDTRFDHRLWLSSFPPWSSPAIGLSKSSTCILEQMKLGVWTLTVYTALHVCPQSAQIQGRHGLGSTISLTRFCKAIWNLTPKYISMIT